MTNPKIYEDVEQWESRQLGADEAYVKKSATSGEELDAALGLKPISIRLQQGMIEDLKAIAALHGIGYQPMIKQILARFIERIEIMEAQTFESVFDAIADTPAEAANMRLRAELMQHIETIIKAEQLTQKQAAARCGITQPRVNDLLNGKINKFSLDALVNINAHLGQQISLNFSFA